MLCAVRVSMPMLKTTSSSSYVVATILEGASCYDLASRYFSFPSHDLLRHLLYFT
jgi:hypothetical protein